MYNPKGKAITSGLQNTITVTPIKYEVDLTNENAGPSVSISFPNEEKKPKTKKPPQQRFTVHKVPPTIDTFWPTILEDVQNIQQVDAKHQVLPLARIKKIMKLDENAKMIAAEAPLLFAKACEYFIQELTMRAWVHTDEGKRRTLQRSDIAQAISNCDQFDFLIDIVPRVEVNVSEVGSAHDKDTASSRGKTQAASTVTVPSQATATVTIANLSQEQQQQLQQQQQHQQLQIVQQQQPQQLQYFIQLPGQPGHPPQLHQVQQIQQMQPHSQHQQLNIQQTNGLTIGNQQLAGINIVAAPQNIILTATPSGGLSTNAQQAQAHQTALIQGIHSHQVQPQHQQIQLLQQVVTPNGEITNVPISITANQLNLLRMQMQQQQQQHPQVLIPTHMQAQPQQTQLVHIGPTGNVTATSSGTANSAGGTSIAHNVNTSNGSTGNVQIQSASGGNIFLNTGPTGNSIVSTDRNLGSTYRPNC